MRGRSDRGPQEALVSRLAGLLPPDVVVHRATPAPVGFDARFSAVRRRYVYRVSDDPRTRDPLRRSHVLWQRRALDVDAMQAGVQALLGRHDFSAFCKPREGATTIRTLEIFDWERPSSGPDAGLVVAHVQADAFCHSMVRALVGASLAVGAGRRSVDWLADLLVGRLRDPAGAVVPAHGLTLEEVTYPPDDQLASRAEQTRALRSHDEVDAAPRTATSSRPEPSGAVAPGAPH
ncbi:tRNA pseudouridine synthase A [mine drainage metagenome]|uniref:tRNA pseudouridine synthase A n=1 Tax=mine drainage metagenome TaxID=410659 RepID=A0A1J5QYP1_9ZZZZ